MTWMHRKVGEIRRPTVLKASRAVSKDQRFGVHFRGTGFSSYLQIDAPFLLVNHLQQSAAFDSVAWLIGRKLSGRGQTVRCRTLTQDEFFFHDNVFEVGPTKNG